MISKRCYLIALVALFLLPFSAPFASAGLPVPPKHPLDRSEYRRKVLDNGLKVLMVSDPRFNKSAASMAVGVGSLSSPRERQGLAHFLEHMLFLGTEKYAGVDDYSSYIKENGGYGSAYTAGDLTNYFLEVNHDAFEGALDRFVQFFISPLFTEKYTERELNAVHSEHQKNLENDGRRIYQVQRSFFREDHPASMFSTGSMETLGGASREEVIQFYREFYSANQMNLVLLGKAPLDSLERWAEKHFSGIENRALQRPTFDPEFMPEKETFRLIRIEPVKELRSLELLFPLPGLFGYYESKPGDILGNLIGHEGKGSLLSLLKQEGLATALGAGAYPLTHDYGLFGIDVTLTPKGLDHYQDVVRLALAYVDMLKTQEYPTFYLQESRAKAKLDEIYSDRGEGANRAASLSGMMPKYPLDVVERVPYLYEKEDPEAYRLLLSHLQPDNMLATLTAKGLEATETESHYGTKYGYAEDDAFYQSLLDLPSRPELHLPPPNPYMPRQATIPDRAQKEGVRPTKIIDEPGLTLYQSLDFEFLRP
ncbi:MAG: insulinase family protein, partial [Candidatus Latescibacteria bacterium]|nr:insulinase family protein [Candidatus Latescibacterota bacterium]